MTLAAGREGTHRAVLRQPPRIVMPIDIVSALTALQDQATEKPRILSSHAHTQHYYQQKRVLRPRRCPTTRTACNTGRLLRCWATQRSCAVRMNPGKSPHSTRSAPPKSDNQVTCARAKGCAGLQGLHCLLAVFLTERLNTASRDTPPKTTKRSPICVGHHTCGGAQYAFDL